MQQEQKSIYLLLASLATFAFLCFVGLFALGRRDLDVLITMGLTGTAAAHYFWQRFKSSD